MSEVHFVAHGARTPLGLQAAASAAARRAGINAAAAHPFMIDSAGDRMTVARDLGADPALFGPGRLLAIAEPALREACEGLRSRSGERLRMPLLVALPELRPGFSQADLQTVRTGLQGLTGLAVDIVDVVVSASGHAGGLALFAMALERMQQGAFEMCLIGGVDSYLEPDAIDWLESHRQVVGANARSAFVPGEGAGFCLLMSDAARQRHGLPSLGRLSSAAIGQEKKLIKSNDICLGEGLTEVVGQVLNALPASRRSIHQIVCDVNGERYRGEEWGFVCLRLGASFDDPTGYWSPADAWGDVGAASGPLFAMLTCEASARGYLGGQRTMLWASSEGGLRAAAILETELHR